MSPDEDNEAACPVCGKMVSLDVMSCPYCGAEFEEEEEETPAAAAPVEEDEGAACPVCGKVVSLDVTACPNCGAEFEEEEYEEVIEVEERRVAEEEDYVEEERVVVAPPTSILDLRVLGIALAALGVLGAIVAIAIDWFWSWVPPIEDNIPLFVMLPVVVVIVGLLVFTLVKKAVSSGQEIPGMLPGFSLSLFVFGIMALIVMLLYNPINSALQDSQVGIAGAFLVLVIVGILVMFMGTKNAAKCA